MIDHTSTRTIPHNQRRPKEKKEQLTSQKRMTGQQTNNNARADHSRRSGRERECAESRSERSRPLVHGEKKTGVELPNQSVIDFPPLSIPPSLIACAHWQKLVLVAGPRTRYQPRLAKR